jgi:hypothetical protein
MHSQVLDREISTGGWRCRSKSHAVAVEPDAIPTPHPSAKRPGPWLAVDVEMWKPTSGKHILGGCEGVPELESGIFAKDGRGHAMRDRVNQSTRERRVQSRRCPAGLD